MNLKYKIKEIIRESSDLRLTIDRLEKLMDDEVLGWAESKQDAWPDEWALHINNLRQAVIQYASNIPTPNKE